TIHEPPEGVENIKRQKTTNTTEKINKRGPGRPRKNPLNEIPNKKVVKRKRGRPRKKRIHKPHTNLTLESTESTTDKYKLIRKKPRTKNDSEDADNDNCDTSDSEASVYSVEMGINPRILREMHSHKSRDKTNLTSDSDDTPHHIEKIKNETEKENQIKQIEDSHVNLDRIDTTDRIKIHTLLHSPPYSSETNTNKRKRIINEPEEESIKFDSNNDDEYTLAQNILLPSSHSSSETETASETENNNRGWSPQRTANNNNNVEEEPLPVINTANNDNHISDINNQTLQINNSSGSEREFNNLIIATAEIHSKINEKNIQQQSPHHNERRIKRKCNCNKSSSGSMTLPADINTPARRPKKIAKRNDTTTSVLSNEIIVINNPPTEIQDTHVSPPPTPQMHYDEITVTNISPIEINDTQVPLSPTPPTQVTRYEGIPTQERPIIRDNIQIYSNIIEIADNLDMRKDNYICFLETDGAPIDDVGRNLIQNGLIPPPSDQVDYQISEIIVNFTKNKIIFGIIIGRKNSKIIMENDLNNAMKNLVNKLKELNVKSASISQGLSVFDSNLWRKIKNALRLTLIGINIKITICKEEITTPNPNQIRKIIKENHETPFAGHK
ncbi:hypothetical protein PV325_009952, partial [Microctonus aethiopoides]